MEPIEDKKPRAAKNPDRVSLGKLESEKVERWLGQINRSSRGFLVLTKSDVVNFLVRQHREELLSKELSRIRADYYHPIRHINWITPQLKAALAGGDMVRVSELQAEIRGIELSVIREGASSDDAAPVRRSRKSKPKSGSKTVESESGQGAPPEEGA